ncbi:MAG: tRNA uridine-5-carboxymethylaminomethyl(34) synthesis GTPase MnmE [Saprospiraceae bacterium]|nr:tRNA uridine-5-carboxymethylaminomethyl(34) synthesis GTPase MnmE [Saprospiraceae bacterium]
MNYTRHNLDDTIVALATPNGMGAIAIIRLSGKTAISIVNQTFKGKDLTQQPSHTIHFGFILNESGEVLDEVLVSLFFAPKSYTKENVAEVSCHGSPYITAQLLQLFIRKGARLAQPGEFTMRAFLHGQMDLSQAEAVADLIASDTQRAHAIALQQMRGGFSKDIATLRQQLIDFASLIELELDFSEEDVEFADRTALKNLVTSAQQLVNSLIQSFQLGNAIKNGINTVIAGRPNAGKSTLLNALLNEERAIVSPIAGTTRDTVEEVLQINGIAFRLIDTAGIRAAQDQIEAIGVAKTMQKIEQSAMVLYVFDIIQTSPADVASDIQQLFHNHTPFLLVANKMDLNPYTKMNHYTSSLAAVGLTISPQNFIPVAAAHQMNIEWLKSCIYQTAIQQDISSDTILTNTRHVEALQKAAESLTAITQGLNTGISSDFIAMDIRQALHHLGTVTGEVSTDDLLGNIFSRFCIGK